MGFIRRVLENSGGRRMNVGWTVMPPTPGLEELLTEIVHRIKSMEKDIKVLKE